MTTTQDQQQVRYTAHRDGLLNIFENLNTKIFTNKI